MYRSALFRRNNGGRKTAYRRQAVVVAARSARSIGVLARRTAPHPPKSQVPISSKSIKGVWFDLATREFNTVGGAPFHIDVIPQGVEEQDRIGNKWQNMGLHLRGQVLPDLTSATASQMGTMYVIWDKQPNQALPVFAEIFTGTGGFEFINLGYQDRFVVCFKKNYLSQIDVTNDKIINGTYFVDEYIDLKPFKCVATSLNGDATGLIANRSTGALLLVTTGNIATGAGPPSVNLEARVYFQDV